MASSSVGEQLRKARETRRLTVSQVADATKIKSDHITALEESDFSPFSAPVCDHCAMNFCFERRARRFMVLMDNGTVMIAMMARIGDKASIMTNTPAMVSNEVMS